jgi:hypothetical protein
LQHSTTDTRPEEIAEVLHFAAEVLIYLLQFLMSRLLSSAYRRLMGDKFEVELTPQGRSTRDPGSDLLVSVIVIAGG